MSQAQTAEARKVPFYARMSFQVLFAIAAAILFGYLSPARAVAMKPLGDGFIRLITMIITVIIFCTVVTGIAGMEDLKKVGRVGGKALLYFEAVSTLALLIGLVVGNVVQPGSGWNVNPATLDAKSIAEYAGQAKAQSIADFFLHIVPTTVVEAFAKGDILQVLLISIVRICAVGCRREVQTPGGADRGSKECGVRHHKNYYEVCGGRHVRCDGVHGGQVWAECAGPLG